MRRVVLRGMLGRKLRTGLTAFAVVLGVAMVSGAYILTDTLLNAADGLERAAYEGVDAVVSSREAFDVDTNNGFSEPKPISAAILPRVRSVSEVGVAQGEVQDEARLIGRDGKTIGGEGGPTFAVGYNGFEPGAAELSPFTFDAGGFPRGPRDIAIDAGTADDEGYGVGDTIGVSARGPVRQFRITGIARFGDVQSIGNATAAIFTLQTAQSLFKKPGQVDSILVDGEGGSDPAELAKAIAPVLPPAAQVKTRAGAGPVRHRRAQGLPRDPAGRPHRLRRHRAVRRRLHHLQHDVHHRRPAGARVRAGAHGGRQPPADPAVGDPRGVRHRGDRVGGRDCSPASAWPTGLNAVFKALGADLPDSGTVFKTRTVVVAFVVGIGVTVVAALAPARRATRVAPGDRVPRGRPR